VWWNLSHLINAYPLVVGILLANRVEVREIIYAPLEFC